MTLFGLSLLGSTNVGATLFTHPYTVPEMAERSERVVVGEVTAMYTQSRDGEPWTVAEVLVEDTLRGREGLLVSVAWPGGKVGEVYLTIDGTPKLIPGDRGVFFVRPDGQLVGMAQGLLYVDDGVAWRDLSHLGFVDEVPQGPEVFSVEELRDLVE
jgi:hypothetical protein